MVHLNSTEDPVDTGWYPRGFVNPADNPEIDWVVPATDDDPVPPEDRLAEEPEQVEADWDSNTYLAEELGGQGEAPFHGQQPRRFVQPGFGGLDLRDYSRTAQQKGWGAPCASARATVRLTEAAVTVDARLAELTGLVMRECERRGYLFRRADTGAYNCRYIGGTTTWSNHAWAVAVDVNWQSNPYTSLWTTDIPEWMHHLWNRYGFAWGGDYTGGKRDFMHFEFMGTPQQAQTALVLARRELAGITWRARVDAVPGTRALSLGDVGTDVRYVQRWHGGMDFDGYFGTSTDKAVRATQARNDLTVDGVVGPDTWKVMGLSDIPLMAGAVSTLYAGQTLASGRTLASSNGWRASMQVDGNFVIRRPDGSVRWHTQTYAHGGASMVMQTDGNLVIYDAAHKPLWQSDTDGKGGARLVMQTDGNLVIYRADGRAIWSFWLEE